MSFKISLAGDLGSGKSTVGKILSRKLGAEVYSTGTIQRQIATEMGMTTLQLNQYMETHPEIDGKIDDGLRALEHSEKNLIIDSRMAWHFVPSSFSVYMAADPFVSAERILKAGRESEPFSTVEEAVASISDRRKSEMFRYSHLYGVNIKDLENYDYVIDTSYIPPETVAEHIAVHFELHRAGKQYPRYALCPARLLPCLNGEGEPAFFEQDGFYFIAQGERKIAAAIRAGAPLVSCDRAQGEYGEECAEKHCTSDKIAAWERETGVKIARLPAWLKR